MFKFVVLVALASLCWAHDPMENPNLFEGDIANAYWDKASKSVAITPGLIFGKWPSRTVNFQISSEYTPDQRDLIMQGIRAIEEQTRRNGIDCIIFREIATSTYLNFQKTGGGCYSNVGRRVTPGAQVLSLDEGCLVNMTVSHEIMHALGFYHEQSRPDRDNYVIIYFENIQEGMESNFNKYTTGVDLAGSTYDRDSIMHYNNGAFSKNGLDTIVHRDGQPLLHTRFKYRLTDADAQSIRTYYGC